MMTQLSYNEKLELVGRDAFIDHAQRIGFAIDSITPETGVVWLENERCVDMMDSDDFNNIIIDILLSRCEACEYALENGN